MRARARLRQAVSVSAAAVLCFAVAAAPIARGEESWDAEFESVCSKTQDAMALSTEELKSLVTTCDELRPRLDALDASRRKVYAKRLQLCRDLYDFVLQSRTPR